MRYYAVYAACVCDTMQYYNCGLFAVAIAYCVCCLYCAIFATAHSCGLRRFGIILCCAVFIFATAHSRGLRLHRQKIPPVMLALCHSAFVRVATLGLNVNCRVTSFATAHSRGLRRRYQRTCGHGLFAVAIAYCGCLLCVLSVLCYEIMTDSKPHGGGYAVRVQKQLYPSDHISTKRL